MTTTTQTHPPRLSGTRIGMLLLGMAAGAALMGAFLVVVTTFAQSSTAGRSSDTGIPPSFTVGYGDAFSEVRKNAVVPSAISGYQDAFATQRASGRAPWEAGYQEGFSSRKGFTSAAWIGGYQDAFAAQEKETNHLGDSSHQR